MKDQDLQAENILGLPEHYIASPCTFTKIKEAISPTHLYLFVSLLLLTCTRRERKRKREASTSELRSRR